jgi:hypothetical protein
MHITLELHSGLVTVRSTLANCERHPTALTDVQGGSVHSCRQLRRQG